MTKTTIPFINIQVSNQDGFVEIEDKEPIDETIHTYVDVFVRAMRGLTFLEQTVADGFRKWLEDIESTPPPTEEEDEPQQIKIYSSCNPDDFSICTVLGIKPATDKDWHKLSFISDGTIYTWTVSSAQISGEAFSIDGNYRRIEVI